jgi:hypothetical protein
VYNHRTIRRISAESMIREWLHGFYAKNVYVMGEIVEEDSFFKNWTPYFDIVAGDYVTSRLGASLFVTSQGFVVVCSRRMLAGRRGHLTLWK